MENTHIFFNYMQSTKLRAAICHFLFVFIIPGACQLNCGPWAHLILVIGIELNSDLEISL